MSLENTSLEQKLLTANDADFITFFQEGKNIDQLWTEEIARKSGMKQTVVKLSEPLKARIKEVFNIKKDITAWNKAIILLFAQKQLIPAIHSPTAMPEQYQQHKNAFIARQKEQIQQGVKNWAITMDTAMLDHTKHQANRAKGNDIEEILKVVRGYGENFTANGQTKAERRVINQQYLPLNPEGLEKVPTLMDFLLHGTTQKGYSLPQKALLVEEIMTPEGTEKFKQALFSHLKLRIDGSQVYKALETYTTDLFSRAHPKIAMPDYVVNHQHDKAISNDRILTFSNDKGEKLYLRSRRNGFLYAEPHLKSYTGDAPALEVFTTEIQLKNTLWEEWENLGKQIERIEEEHSNLITETRRIQEVLHNPKELEEVLTNMENYTKQFSALFAQEVGRTTQKIRTLTDKRKHRDNIQKMIDHLIRQAELRLAESVAKREYLGQFLQQVNTDPRFREGRNEKGEKVE